MTRAATNRPSSASDVPGRSRSDSFVRMLELEKLFKMQRIQQNHAPSTNAPSIAGSPRTSFPADTTPSPHHLPPHPSPPPPQRSRRMSAHPPLSHQTQIMKAVRRSAALPSLSLSIPLAPPTTDRQTMRSNGGADSSSREDRITKSVTFSEPQEDSEGEGAHLSDTSSICQSPSWAQYGQKKKKKKNKPKKLDDSVLKKRGNRLTKTTPIVSLVAKPLTASDRSLSAVELDHMSSSNQENVPPSMIRSQSAMARPQPPASASAGVNGKPKSRGFLSGLKFQHANVAAAQKIVEMRNAGQDDGTLRAIQYENTVPSQQPSLIRPGMDTPATTASRSKRPPSIRSVMTTSSQSVSSTEKRNSGIRNSIGSGHNRSQSLLSSTLNKLKGPSYLYYRRPSEDGTLSDAHAVEPAPSQPVQVSRAKAENTPKQKNTAAIEHAQQPHEFSFPRKPRRANTEPGPDIAPRARPPRTRKLDIRDPNQSQEGGEPTLRPLGDRRVQIEAPPAVAPRDAVMAKVMAQERQSQNSRVAQPISCNVEGVRHGGSRDTGPESKRPYTQSIRSDVRFPRSAQGEELRDYSGLHHPDPRELASRAAGRGERLEGGERDMQDDDQASVNTHTSTIRPASRTQNKGQQISPYNDAKHTRWYSSEMEDDDAGLSPQQPVDISPLPAHVEDPTEDLITFERERPAAIYHPAQLASEGNVDYFAFFSESYNPPPLELSSPTESTFRLHSPPIAEDVEDEEETELSHSTSDGVDARGQEEAHDSARHRPSAANPPEPQLKAATRISGEHKPKGSPGMSAQHSDSDVPALERLGLSTKAARILAGGETDSSTSTAPSQATDPSHATSERSSSPMCDDAPPSISPASTPNSSRPQSRRGPADSGPDPSQTTLVASAMGRDDRHDKPSGRRRFKGAFIETTPRLGQYKEDAQNRDWNGVAAVSVDLAAPPTPTYIKSEGLASSPLLVATPTSSQFAGGVKEYDGWRNGDGQSTPPATAPVPAAANRAHSALDLRSTAKTLPHPLKSHRLNHNMKEAPSSVSLPNSPPPDATDEVFPRKSALKMSRNHSTNALELSSTASSGAAYLQEARKAVPMPPTSSSSARALRPHFPQKNSSTSTKSSVSSSGRTDPLAKMLVECCNCHFFHDMPSRVYECMAKPDSVVEDRALGVSAAIKTTVRCPWCAHGMTTQCCSGYAAVVYLKEKLHGK
ncbi:hypothetical protein GGR57DRAFT_329938 [Xylariaceae sp. FL1272]|nr:hypothetical protein GGR57DRAFT_329938 [Xylariaceae sp. FL1272]